MGRHGSHPVGPSTDYLVCDECDYCAQTDPDFTSWEDHWATHDGWNGVWSDVAGRMSTPEERIAELERRIAHLESDLKAHQHCYRDTMHHGEVKRVTDIPNWIPPTWLPEDGPPA